MMDTSRSSSSSGFRSSSSSSSRNNGITTTYKKKGVVVVVAVGFVLAFVLPTMDAFCNIDPYCFTKNHNNYRRRIGSDTTSTFKTTRSFLQSPIRSPSTTTTTTTTSLNMFFLRNKKNNDDKDKEDKEEENEDEEEEEEEGKKNTKVEQEDNNGKKNPTDNTPNSMVSSTTSNENNKEEVVVEEETAVMRAKKLKAQAERARLEAERMDAELTLQKIARLEKEMTLAASKDNQEENVQQLQQEIEALQAKITGETRKATTVSTTITSKPKTSTSELSSSLPSTSTSTSKSTSTSTETKTTTETPTDSTATTLSTALRNTTTTNVFMEPLLEGKETVEDIVEMMDGVPSVMKKLLASMVELDYNEVQDINTTELAIRMKQLRERDYSYSSLPPPTFTTEQIEQAKKELRESPSWFGEVRGIFGETSTDPSISSMNETELAILSLETEYYAQVFDEQNMQKVFSDEELFQQLLEAVNQTTLDESIGALYPICTRKKGQQPTMEQIQQLITDILPKTSFRCTGTPEPVLGGYILRGTVRNNINNKDDKDYPNNKQGDLLIQEIDQQLSKYTNLQSKIQVLFTKDFTLVAKAEDAIEQGDESIFFQNDINRFDPDNQPPILYVTGNDITRESNPFLLSITTALGLASCWYLSLYPFLLNPNIMTRVEDQLDLANAGMDYDLAFLTDLSVPLFVTFVAIQMIHDFSHLIVSKLYGFKITAPTFVPSLITGLTSSVMTFRGNPPNNKEEMFDVSMAGPLSGMIASMIALYVGSQYTIYNADPSMVASTYPSLPLEILRQSSLGGGIIDAVLGNGALSVPDAAIGTRAVAEMTVPLHPMAVAGYIGLIVNALCLLPIGTTDGGRIALTLFGRTSKLFIGNLALFTLLFLGLVGSDLFLFYFAFCIAFQTGNEIPSRNEVDDISFSRVIVAIGSYVLAVLALIPIQ